MGLGSGSEVKKEKGRRGLGFFGFWVFCLFVCLIEKKQKKIQGEWMSWHFHLTTNH